MIARPILSENDRDIALFSIDYNVTKQVTGNNEGLHFVSLNWKSYKLRHKTTGVQQNTHMSGTMVVKRWNCCF